MATEFKTKSSTPQVNVHYVNTGAPGMVEELGGDFFDQFNRSLADVLLDQESIYQSIQTSTHDNPPRASASTDSSPGNDQSNEKKEIPKEKGESSGVKKFGSQMKTDEEIARSLQVLEYQVTREINHTDTNLAVSQNNIDPDNMTYEELQSLEESIGTHPRGLSEKLISFLKQGSTSTYKTGHFSRKDKHECVICYMEFKKHDILMTLPCKHHFHSDCVTRWLKIKKTCPVCYEEVFGSS